MRADGEQIDTLIAGLRTSAGDETGLHRQAWALCGVPIPPDGADLLARGAFLESILSLAASQGLQGELVSWEISYTSAGPPYMGAIGLRSADRTVRIFSGASSGSATRALLAVLLEALA